MINLVQEQQSNAESNLSTDDLKQLASFFDLLFTIDRRLKITDKYLQGQGDDGQ